MTAQEIRKKYLEFFEARGHILIPRARLVPDNDPTTLFTGSGMQPLIPYLLGEKHPAGQRLVDSQTCLRAQDIDEVGDNRHTTFFEMLGNWSLGDYFKAEQIGWFWEFLTRELALDPSKLYVSCFIGDEKAGIPRDDETASIWQKLFASANIDAKIVEIGSSSHGDKKGMDGGRIFFYDDHENWWSRGNGLAGTPVGDPCGPDSEVFYDFGEQFHDAKFGLAHPASDSPRFMEIGNSVFMQYRRTANGFEELAQKNVDFGGGLERLAAASLDNPDIYKISLLSPIIAKLEEISGKDYDASASAMRVIADHLRASVFLAVDGVTPSNKTQGYVMRRLVRRAIRYAFELGIEQNFLELVVPVIADIYASDYPEVASSRNEVISVLVKEEKAFRQTLRKCLNEMDKISRKPKLAIRWNDGTFHEALPLAATPLKDGEIPEVSATMFEIPLLTGAEIFMLQDTYGFPTELSLEEASLRDIAYTVDWQIIYDQLRLEQRQRSQTAARGTFKGGLGGQTLQHKKYHTATHLLQSALRQIYGPELRQHGSNITEERLRFDFNLDRKMTPEEIARAEELVNGWIAEDLPVTFREYPTAEALKMGAIGPFGERYGETVKVYQMGEGDNIASLEICGGPHVDHTGELADGGKTFKIAKEESSSAGIRRIKAVLAQT